MSEVNFKSQICTTRKQSERLLALGLKKETADMQYHTPHFMPYPIGHKCVGFPAWSLGRLLELSYGDVHPNNVVRISAHNPYEDMIKIIEKFIKHQCFNKGYLV